MEERDQRTVQEPVEASERVKRKSRFLPKTTGKTRRRAATNDWSSKRGDFRQCCPQQWETHVAEPQVISTTRGLSCDTDPRAVSSARPQPDAVFARVYAEFLAVEW
ncbi:hypothetical protein MRX96_015595 [Rhipicephalus microplus]